MTLQNSETDTAPPSDDSTSAGQRAAQNVDVHDPTHLQLLCTFVVQKSGQATVTAILRTCSKHLEVKDLTHDMVSAACEALRSKGVFSFSSGKLPDGQTERAYKMRRAQFAPSPELAHISDLLPELLRTEANEEVLSSFNDMESDGDSKSKRKLGYQDYRRLELRLVTLDVLLGSQPADKSPYMKSMVAKYPHAHPKVEADLVFSRAADGRLELGADALRNWMSNGLRMLNYADSVGAYLAVQAVRFVPHTPLVQFANPVLDKRTGAGMGLTTFECLAAGQELCMSVAYPTRFANKSFTVREFLAFIATYGPAPLRGLSPAKGGRYGRVALIGYQDFGDANDFAASARAVMHDLPDAAQKLLTSLLP